MSGHVRPFGNQEKEKVPQTTWDCQGPPCSAGAPLVRYPAMPNRNFAVNPKLTCIELLHRPFLQRPPHIPHRASAPRGGKTWTSLFPGDVVVLAEGEEQDGEDDNNVLFITRSWACGVLGCVCARMQATLLATVASRWRSCLDCVDIFIGQLYWGNIWLIVDSSFNELLVCSCSRTRDINSVVHYRVIFDYH